MIEGRDTAPIRDQVALGAMSRVFLQISLCGFGGGLALAHRIVVDERQWLTEPEFADIVSLCQFLPGPNIIGIAVCTGTRLRGAAGALAAAAGFLVIPWGLGLSAGLLLLAHAQHPLLRNTLALQLHFWRGVLIFSRMVGRGWMSGASIEETLELWAASLREVKGRMRPLFTQERVAASAGGFFYWGLGGGGGRTRGGGGGGGGGGRAPGRGGEPPVYILWGGA